jgi:hypothetical protein
LRIASQVCASIAFGHKDESGLLFRCAEGRARGIVGPA